MVAEEERGTVEVEEGGERKAPHLFACLGSSDEGKPIRSKPNETA